MTRKKVTLAYITNDAARKATFKKRKKGLLKKVSELSTLCDIKACAIIYSPFDREPEVWPSPPEVQHTIAMFRGKSEIEQNKKMVNQESFLRQRICKAEEQLKRSKRENREKEVEHVMFKSLVSDVVMQSLGLVDLNELGWLVEKKIKEIDEKMRRINEENSKKMNEEKMKLKGSSQPSNKVVKLCDQGKGVGQSSQEAGKGNAEMPMGGMQNQQWLMELLQSNDMGFVRNNNAEEFPNYGFNSSGFWAFP